MICPFCKLEAKWCENKEIYGKNYGKSFMIYLCKPCDAFVGCHENTKEPLGRMANKEMRNWRKQAHAVFDPLWKKKMILDDLPQKKARGKAYAWLAKQLDIDQIECHIGDFNVLQCKQVVAICERLYK